MKVFICTGVSWALLSRLSHLDELTTGVTVTRGVDATAHVWSESTNETALL